ncbi:unnamed protein product [Blepharisma stoltei]|uniref:Uncharacterized protein n=1 Tax=Blepharisma stoltei TaxID=1481888 RepID=A0AAU9JSK8_9CILI|nr:unnamed protein product [Blepharisma stoltei]
MAGLIEKFVWVYFLAMIICCHLSLLICQDVVSNKQSCPSKPPIYDLVEKYIFSVPLIKKSIIAIYSSLKIKDDLIALIALAGIPALIAENMFIVYLVIRYTLSFISTILSNLLKGIVISLVLSLLISLLFGEEFTSETFISTISSNLDTTWHTLSYYANLASTFFLHYNK